MPNLVFNRGKFLVAGGRVSTTTTYQLMLVTTCFEEISDLYPLNLVDDGTTDDPLSYELGVGGYSRQTVAGAALFEDDTNDFAGIDATDVTFSSLSPGANVGGAVLYIYSTSGGSLGVQTTSDTGQELLAFYDVTDTATNGGDITIQWASTTAGGMLKLGSTS
jgi:hypothetical protein